MPVLFYYGIVSDSQPNIMIIGLMGKKFSGKDTCAKHMTSKYNFKRIAFADSLKECCQARYGFSDKQLEEDKDEIDSRWDLEYNEHNTIAIGYAWIRGWKSWVYWANTTECFDRMTNLTWREIPTFKKYMNDSDVSLYNKFDASMMLV